MFKLLFNDQAHSREVIGRSGERRELKRRRGVNRVRPQSSMNAVLYCSDVELDVWKKWGIMVLKL